MTTDIEWTQIPGYKGETWNPTLGCERASPGCTNCYAAAFAHRGLSESHRGLTTLDAYGVPRFNGVAREMPGRLDLPMRWRKPRAVFVNSMSDLFLPKFSNEFIAAVFGVMGATPQHIFMVLTKHPDRAREWFAWIAERPRQRIYEEARQRVGARMNENKLAKVDRTWPLPNVWLGTSVESQGWLEKRVGALRDCPAAVRFVSAEPLLGGLDLARHMWPVHYPWPPPYRSSAEARAAGVVLTPSRQKLVMQGHAFLDWVIVGGESGPRARACNVQWIRDIVQQSKDAGVACFVKQLGAVPTIDPPPRVEADHEAGPWRMKLEHGKGGDPSEWPADLDVREFPKVAA